MSLLSFLAKYSKKRVTRPRDSITVDPVATKPNDKIYDKNQIRTPWPFTGI